MNRARDRMARSSPRDLAEKSFVVLMRGGGENDFSARNIRKSISLTMLRLHSMICVSKRRRETA
jgi:hypothetical protein